MTLHLQIRVVEGRDIPKMDAFGKVDPFVMLRVESSKIIQNTRAISKTFTPVWNEEFNFNIKDPSSDSLICLLKDRDQGSADDPISRLIIPLRDMEINKVYEKWYHCQPVKGVKKGGQLRLVIQISDGSLPPFVEPKEIHAQQPTPTSQQVPPQQMYQPQGNYPQQPPPQQYMGQPGMYPPQQPQGQMYYQQPPQGGYPQQPGMYPQGNYPPQTGYQPQFPGQQPQMMYQQPGMYPQGNYPPQ